MKGLLNKKNLTYAALAIMVIGAGVYFMGKSGTPEPITMTAGTSSGAEAKFLGLASKLQSVSFDTALFSDPRFTSLQDITASIVPEPSGRKDPFATLPGVTAE